MPVAFPPPCSIHKIASASAESCIQSLRTARTEVNKGSLASKIKVCSEKFPATKVIVLSMLIGRTICAFSYQQRASAAPTTSLFGQRPRLQASAGQGS